MVVERADSNQKKSSQSIILSIREKKWVTIEDTTMQIFKWVPIRIDEQTKQQQESQLQLDGSNQNGNNQYKSNDESQEISEVKTPTIPMNNSDETKHNDDDERRQQQQQQQQTIAERLAAGCGDDQDKKSSDPTQVMTNGNKENNLSLIGGSSTTTTTMAEIPSSTLQTLEKSHVTPVISQSASEIKSSGPGSSQADDGIVFEELAQVKRPSVDQQKVISTEIEQQVQSGPVVGTSSGSITLSSDAKVLEPTVKPVQSGPAEIAEKRQHEDVDKDLSRVEPPMKQIKVTDKPVSESRADLEEKEESKKQVKASMVDDETATNSTVTKTTTTITTTAAAPDAEQKVSEERADDKSDDNSGKESEEKPMDTSMAEP